MSHELQETPEGLPHRCRLCGKPDCDDDCEERELIWRDRQRQIAEELA